jgi:small subunit ribosomal protein S1
MVVKQETNSTSPNSENKNVKAAEAFSRNSKAKNTKWMEAFGAFSDEDAEASTSKGNENFGVLFEESHKNEVQEGQIIEGKVVNIGDENVTVDIAFKCEGHISIQEFKDATGVAKVALGDVLSCYVERVEIERGYVILSKDRADIIKAWDEISAACENDEIVEGTVIAKVKGGLLVDIGVKAFLPASQLDAKAPKAYERLVGQKMKFKIHNFQKKRGNIVLSRKAVVQQERELQRAETLSQLQEGMVVTGVVKNITEYGAFIDLGGMDGLLHITDMSWGRIKHPSELFKVNDEIKVKILKYDREKERVSLGLKQVSANPWDEAEFKFPVGKIISGKIVSLKDYGAFIELEDGVEGLIHVSEMSWTERVKHPSKILKPGDTVECKVLEVDSKNKKISLGIKQLQNNPWDELETRYPLGSIVEEAEVKSITDFGVFLDVGMGIDGLVHVSDMSWTKKFNHPSEKFKKGDKIRALVLGIDKANEKFSLGVKQLERDPWESIKSRYRVGQAIDGRVTKLTDFGAFVELEEGIEGLVYVSEISSQRIEKPSDILKIGDEVRAEILSIEPKERRIGLSIKQLGRSEERSNFDSYAGDKTKKSSMGDVFGEKLKAALKKPSDKKTEDQE